MSGLYYGEGPLRVGQVGRPDFCAKDGCGRHAQYRLIMSSHVVQVYVCSGHLPWGVNLDLHRDKEWLAMGAVPRKSRSAGVEVIPEMGPIRRLNFCRPLGLSACYPVPGEGHDYGDGLPTYLPAYRECV